MKAHIKNYMSLTKKEWNGMVVMLVLIALVLTAPYVLQGLRKDSTINISDFNAAVVRLDQANPAIFAKAATKQANVTPFKFNPNHLPADKWAAMGLSQKQVGIIQNFQAKGGRFYKPTDLKKIYGITDADYNRLAPYIVIPQARIAVKPVIELNSSDSSALMSVDGIGRTFATRILYYRERLGGYTSKEQLKEVFGMDDMKYREISSQLRVDAARIRKVNINTITFDKLRLMPYLNYKQVNALIEYRKQHGDYAAMADLKNIAIIDDDILRKIEPYIVFK